MRVLQSGIARDTACCRSPNRTSRKLAIDSSTGAVYAFVAITAVGTNGGTVVTNTVNSHAFTPKTPEAFLYDLDGNLTADGRWTYTWDAENRLMAMQSKILFAYDSQ